MRLLMLSILVGALSAGCGALPWGDGDTGLACQHVAPPGVAVRDGDPLAPGEPMAGLDVTAMTPAEVGAAAVDRGLPVTWRYEFDIGEAHGVNGYSECWCVAPAGRVTQVLYSGAGELIVFVDAGQVLPAARPQPHLGWGCSEASARETHW
jgi:hypothetical protein